MRNNACPRGGRDSQRRVDVAFGADGLDQAINERVGTSVTEADLDEDRNGNQERSIEPLFKQFEIREEQVSVGGSALMPPLSSRKSRRGRLVTQPKCPHALKLVQVLRAIVTLSYEFVAQLLQAGALGVAELGIVCRLWLGVHCGDGLHSARCIQSLGSLMALLSGANRPALIWLWKTKSQVDLTGLVDSRS